VFTAEVADRLVLFARSIISQLINQNMASLTAEGRPLTADEMSEYRHHARAFWGQTTTSSDTCKQDSWVRPDADPAWLDSRSEACRFFDTHGFLVVPHFADDETVGAMKKQMQDLAENDWDPSKSVDTFGTDSASNTKRGDYFLDSSNKVHYFAEPTALESSNDGKQQLKPHFQKDVLAALNKAGHGMHTIPGSFREYTLSRKMKELVTDLGWIDPVVPQSMYIFKQPNIGGTVHSHQDSTFLFTEPRQTCLGLWLALDDATLDNGCLWVRPGSHREPLRRQFIRNPDYFEGDNVTVPKLVFRIHNDNCNVPWEGELPLSLSKEGFIPVEVKAGDLVTFCGTLDHLSLPNFSSLQRHTFQLHLVEGPREGIKWSYENWLQYPPGAEFLRLIKLE
jgi:phytanoyl-CoA hydroxylase